MLGAPGAVAFPKPLRTGRDGRLQTSQRVLGRPSQVGNLLPPPRLSRPDLRNRRTSETAKRDAAATLAVPYVRPGRA